MDSHVVSAIIRLVLNLVMPQKAGSALQTATKIVQMLLLLDEVGRQLLHVESTKVILKLAYLKPDR